MDIAAEDCRLEGFVGGGSSRYYRAVHLPTGVIITIDGGTPSKREAMKALQAAVNKAADLDSSYVDQEKKS